MSIFGDPGVHYFCYLRENVEKLNIAAVENLLGANFLDKILNLAQRSSGRTQFEVCVRMPLRDLDGHAEPGQGAACVSENEGRVRIVAHNIGQQGRAAQMALMLVVPGVNEHRQFVLIRHGEDAAVALVIQRIFVDQRVELDTAHDALLILEPGLDLRVHTRRIPRIEDEVPR